MSKIETAGLESIAIIRDISRQTWAVTYQDILSPQQIAYMLEMMYAPEALEEQITRKGHHFLMARENSEYTGFASYELNHNGLSATKIHKIYVLPSVQGKGTGKLLIDAIKDIARSQLQQSLSLNVNRNNKAVQFYRHIGFKIAAEEDIDIGNGYLMEDYIMELDL